LEYFKISAKKNLQENDVRGPGVYKKTKDVEYTVFLPFDVIAGHPDVSRHALRYLLSGVRAVFERLEIDAAKVAEKQEFLIEGICSDPTMFRAKDER
jgi:hypothetical protein